MWKKWAIFIYACGRGHKRSINLVVQQNWKKICFKNTKNYKKLTDNENYITFLMRIHLSRYWWSIIKEKHSTAQTLASFLPQTTTKSSADFEVVHLTEYVILWLVNDELSQQSITAGIACSQDGGTITHIFKKWIYMKLQKNDIIISNKLESNWEYLLN